MQNQPKRTATITLIAILGAALLSACSSKPETSDIQKELARLYACPVLELSGVEKVDGAEVGSNLYDVAFTYTETIKGGKDAAIRLFTKIEQESQSLHPMPNLCNNPADTALFYLHESLIPSIQSGTELISVPIALNRVAEARMLKTESGWHFTNEYTDASSVKKQQIITSEPVAYPRPASPDR